MYIYPSLVTQTNNDQQTLEERETILTGRDLIYKLLQHCNAMN